MKVASLILGLAAALLAPASAHAVACPTLGSSLYDTPGSNCQLGSLVTSGPTPVIAGLSQTLVGSPSGNYAQESAGSDVFWGGGGGQPGVTIPSPVVGNVVFFGPHSMTAVSSATIPSPGGPGVNGQMPLSRGGGVPRCGTLGNPCPTATPEPTSLVLLGSGLIVLGGAAFRRYRRRQIQTV